MLDKKSPCTGQLFRSNSRRYELLFYKRRQIKQDQKQKTKGGNRLAPPAGVEPYSLLHIEQFDCLSSFISRIEKFKPSITKSRPDNI